MPRRPRLDWPGALHHVIVRGIERRNIFTCDLDRRNFVDRLNSLATESGAVLYAWALMPNHAHILLRTGIQPLSRFAQRWLGFYASAFNRRHRRAGHLFQNRFKSILVQADPYLLELVRYIHLNPVRSRLPIDVESLDTYPWTGHSVILGNQSLAAQDCNFVLAQFATETISARRNYRQFVVDGLREHENLDLDGNGLRRSRDGWQLVPTLDRGREEWEFDERILGSSQFVAQVLDQVADQRLSPPVDTEALLGKLCQEVASFFAVTEAEIATSTHRPQVVAARAVLCDIAVRHHSISTSAVARHLSISRTSVVRAINKAPSVYAEHGCDRPHFIQQ